MILPFFTGLMGNLKLVRVFPSGRGKEGVQTQGLTYHQSLQIQLRSLMSSLATQLRFVTSARAHSLRKDLLLSTKQEHWVLCVRVSTGSRPHTKNTAGKILMPFVKFWNNSYSWSPSEKFNTISADTQKKSQKDGVTHINKASLPFFQSHTHGQGLLHSSHKDQFNIFSCSICWHSSHTTENL